MADRIPPIIQGLAAFAAGPALCALWMLASALGVWLRDWWAG